MFQKAPAGPGETDTFKIAAINERIFPDTFPGSENPLLVNPETQDIQLYGAGGETVAFLMILPSGDGSVRNLVIDPMARIDGDIAESSVIEPARWRVYQVLNVPVATYDVYDAKLTSPSFLTPQSYPDPLLPIQANDAGRYLVPENFQGVTVLWVEVDVPLKSVSAEYAGTLRIESANKKIERSVGLHTWGFDLPSPGVDIFGLIDVPNIWVEHEIGTLREPDRLVLPPDIERTQKLADLVGQYARLLDENGIEPWLTNVFPKITGSDPATMFVDWTGYELLVKSIQKNSNRARQYWPVPADLYYPATQMYGPYSSGLYRQVLKNYLRQFDETFVRSGRIGRAVAVPIWSDSFEESAAIYPTVVDWSRAVRSANSSSTIVHPFVTADFRSMGWPGFKPFDSDLSTAGAICCDEKWLDPSSIESFRARGKAVWWRLASSDGMLPSLRVTYPSFYAQAIPWTAMRYDSSGVVLGSVNAWPATGGRSIDDYGKLGGNVLVYPGRWFGSDQPLGSIRLKMIKRGLQDIAYIRALKNAGRGELADWLTKHLVRYAHADAFDGSIWTLRDDGLCNREQAWMLPSIIAGMELESLRARKTPATMPTTMSSAPTTQQVVVKKKSRLMQKIYTNQFKQYTEGLALENQGVRARNITDVKTGSEKVEWSFHLAMRNFSGEVGPATVGFENVASPLVASKSPDRLPELTWAWPIQSTLKLESPGAALGLMGVNSQNVELKLKNKTSVDLPVRYCALIGCNLGRMVRIDGYFDDWPDLPSSVTGDFLRIHSDGINDQRLDKIERNACRSTLVQIGYDEKNLYLAFTCSEPQDERFSRPTNTVDSSAGLPWGEDLVAVVIDPENAGSLNPLDAYQVIVKANGNVLTFRGTLEANRLNASPSWPNHVRAAVANFPDHWQVEVCIPLDDLNAAAKLNRWWGIDFARVAAGISECSTWSGTADQYARPVSMGNVFLGN
jgi:hypothetical protein